MQWNTVAYLESKSHQVANVINDDPGEVENCLRFFIWKEMGHEEVTADMGKSVTALINRRSIDLIRSSYPAKKNEFCIDPSSLMYFSSRKAQDAFDEVDVKIDLELFQDTLEARARQILELVHYGYSYRETAEITGSSSSAICRAISDIRRRFLKFFGTAA